MQCCSEGTEKKVEKEKKVDLSKIVSVATDGACNMTRKENGFINLNTKQVGYSILTFH